MTANRCLRRFGSNLSLLLALVAGNAGAAAADVPLRPFSATYKLYQGGMHIANSELHLEPSGGEWRWRMTTRARGIFAWLVGKQPYAETRFERDESGFRLSEIVITDEKKPGREESARFDWQRRQVDVLRRGKQRKYPLEGGVYDYQSIHLLAASMTRQQQKEAVIDFYYKGRLKRSRIVYGGESTVKVAGETRAARVYEQIVLRSNSRVKYYYDAERPMLPLRIERLESGESPSIMTLQRVEWEFSN